MDNKDLRHKEAPIAVGLHGLVEQLGLEVPLPVVSRPIRFRRS